MAEHPDVVRRRIVPDEVQLQVILGSLLGDATIEGRRGARRLRIGHRADRYAYARWKYERLGSLAALPPRISCGRAVLETIAHPIFDDLAGLLRVDADGVPRVRRSAVLDRLAPLGLAVWLTDLGRLDLRPDAFLPDQQGLALTA